MIIPAHIPLYGDPTYRGKCHLEHVEQSSIINRLRKEYPDTFGAIAFHPRNEGQKRAGQFSTAMKENAEGLTKGASDLIIPARIPFVAEIKRRDPSKSSISKEQIDYLTAAQALGAFSCVTLGAVATWEAFLVWKASL